MAIAQQPPKIEKITNILTDIALLIFYLGGLPALIGLAVGGMAAFFHWSFLLYYRQYSVSI